MMVFLWNAGTNGQILEKLGHFFVMPTVKLPKYQIEIVMPCFLKRWVFLAA